VYLAKENRNVVAMMAVDRLAHILGNKKRIDKKAIAKPGLSNKPWPSVVMLINSTFLKSGARAKRAFSRCMGVAALPCTKTRFPLSIFFTASSAG
jgi:hypothetical protein